MKPTLKRPSVVEWGCGLSLAVVIGVSLSAATGVSHAEPPTSTAPTQCFTQIGAEDGVPDWASCEVRQVGSVRNP